MSGHRSYVTYVSATRLNNWLFSVRLEMKLQRRWGHCVVSCARSVREDIITKQKEKNMCVRPW